MNVADGTNNHFQKLTINKDCIRFLEILKMCKREDLQRILKIKDFKKVTAEKFIFSQLHSYMNICQMCFSHERETRLKRCTRCKMVYYCEKEHQKAQWFLHKDFCDVATGLFEKKTYPIREELNFLS